MIVISSVLIVLGVLFLVISAIGINTMPDLYTRAHVVAKSETLAMMLVLGGLLLRPELDIHAAVRLVFVLVFSLLGNPTAVHALVRAARRSGVEPWTAIDQATADAELGRHRP